MKLRLISVATAISALLVVTPAVADKKDGHHKHGGKDDSVIVVRGDRDRVTRHSHKHRHGGKKHAHKHKHGRNFDHHRGHVHHYSNSDNFDAEDFFAGMLLYGLIDGLNEH
ncbi:hypothetical protein [Solemya elarraichensis gill symbiont]|uniref:Uncharacterized protein n=1 Tax=Solemya elarraichensis gill symbiont TaxID=1918949 RepID=A0A1T2L186_9GAMM|nr:hypothetical protein [Solemya elarraichensis gill symbiont]OOZ38863.1 hypothetical protein BOW52_07975 [Solemya elarraichensis gill symbiont]